MRRLSMVLGLVGIIAIGSLAGTGASASNPFLTTSDIQDAMDNPVGNAALKKVMYCVTKDMVGSDKIITHEIGGIPVLTTQEGVEIAADTVAEMHRGSDASTVGVSAVSAGIASKTITYVASWIKKSNLIPSQEWQEANRELWDTVTTVVRGIAHFGVKAYIQGSINDAITKYGGSGSSSMSSST